MLEYGTEEESKHPGLHDACWHIESQPKFQVAPYLGKTCALLVYARRTSETDQGEVKFRTGSCLQRVGPCKWLSSGSAVGTDKL